MNISNIIFIMSSDYELLQWATKDFYRNGAGDVDIQWKYRDHHFHFVDVNAQNSLNFTIESTQKASVFGFSLSLKFLNSIFLLKIKVWTLNLQAHVHL